MSKVVTIYDTIEKKTVLENVTQAAAAKHLNISDDHLSKAKRLKKLIRRRYRILDMACEKGEKEYLKSSYDLEFEFRNICMWLRNRYSEEQLKKIAIVPQKERNV